MQCNLRLPVLPLRYLMDSDNATGFVAFCANNEGIDIDGAYCNLYPLYRIAPITRHYVPASSYIRH